MEGTEEISSVGGSGSNLEGVDCIGYIACYDGVSAVQQGESYTRISCG